MQHLVSCYKTWFNLKQHLTKSARYTLGEEIDGLFIAVLKLIFLARYTPQEQKLLILQKANTNFDLLKFFLMILWETKSIETKHYALLSEQLATIGRMLGGWLKKTATEAAH
ncbi:MAG: hypothetical protein COU11_01140 [Candidatus Harrisonbacteria bacterium CG10_big_fil_rev_8_21_14_0_10_49_15]|uniref:bAvd-like domain-containing protein n=1 Tax=Candidatus Harrisonbacteria bacterium CG10_big_fil_rev_8_21_14_0_10_49_15 TaxID=1974587 RepID=A0A2H0UNW0_9BACT|nr:MAG: hypothetical protein COU11_01140 [Candidatus Harrisonbacteria bacterium CG10_big_fil_rev_8_21_14_0_10_49_15]